MTIKSTELVVGWLNKQGFSIYYGPLRNPTVHHIELNAPGTLTHKAVAQFESPTVMTNVETTSSPHIRGKLFDYTLTEREQVIRDKRNKQDSMFTQKLNEWKNKRNG